MRQNQLIQVFTSLCLAFALAASGCESQQTGGEGNLKFAYPNDDDVADFNKAVAVGAKLELRLTDVTGAKVEILAAASDNEKALAVINKLGDKFEIEAKGEGNAKLTVKVRKTDGTEVSDFVNMRALKAEVLKLTHSCTAGKDAIYLTNTTIALTYDLSRKDGQATIGYGYHPLTISPATALTLNTVEKTQWAYSYKTAALPGDVSLTSQLDPTQTWSLRLVEEGAIDGAKVEFSVPAATASVGQKQWLLVRPLVATAPVCQPNTTFTVAVTSADVCTVIAASQSAANTAKLLNTAKGAAAEGFTWLELQGKKAGTCAFAVTWPKALGGKGYTASLQVEVK